ncbi:fatty acid hydroxylase superfamily-domain-containing protein [Tuber borchii]|uniref:Fatty acid hydroxylase superfamily-domain-containing protein n=1 Tax=Tuber borchii TaxID=42251 RepID=A0A2T7A832_TUBBO|nr:fatty acid hydroxylase superfamily-domain-containing protein [Tuber borchii]
MNLTNTTTTPSPPASFLKPLPPLISGVPDSIVLVILPIAAYWALSLFFHFLDVHDLLSSYRLHTPEEVLKRNHVTRREVVKDVIVQQVIQTIVGLAIGVSEPEEMIGGEWWEIMGLYSKFMGDWRYKLVEIAYWYLLPAARFWVAIFIMDTWQYFLHRLMHEIPWLYKTFHSRHHRLYVPYAFGALYNHPFEGLLMDTIGAGMAYKISGLRIRGAMTFFTFSTMKTVDDHCGYALPFDPLQYFFWNNAGYHDVHHQGWGIKTNFSQPFFICWDRWLGTQWTGGDVSARYAASRERAAEQLAKDRTVSKPKGNITTGVPQKGINSTAYVNGGGTNGLKPRMPNGKPKMQADESRRQVLNTDGAGALREERSEETAVENARLRTRVNGSVR